MWWRSMGVEARCGVLCYELALLVGHAVAEDILPSDLRQVQQQTVQRIYEDIFHIEVRAWRFKFTLL